MPKTVDNHDIYGILNVFPHDSRGRYDDLGERSLMVLKLVHSWKTAGASPLASGDPAAGAEVLVDLDEESDEDQLDYDDLEAIHLRERKAEKQKHQEETVAFRREMKQQQAAEQQQREDEDRRLREWHASAEYRQAIAALSADVGDARQSIIRAGDRAAAEQLRAEEDLKTAQNHALTVDGDRRVYFTRDGSRLYGEDDRQITDQAVIADAQNQQRARTDATTYEDYVEKKNADRQAAAKLAQLRESAAKLDELDERIKKGDLSPEDLAQARQDQHDIVAALPPEAREEYARLQAARKEEGTLAYRAADPAFTSAPDLNGEFLLAATAQAAQVKAKEADSSPPADRRAPVYKAAPEF